MTADQIPSPTWKHTKRFLNEDIDVEDIVVAPQLPAKHSLKKQILVWRYTAKKTYTFKPGKKQKDAEECHLKDDADVDGK